MLKRRALEFQHTVQIGRTHGVHAEPITFGLKLAIWYEEAGRNLAAAQAAAEDMRVGKISGAVGTFAHIGPEVEEAICARLGSAARAGGLAGDPARPPRGLRRHAGAARRPLSRRSPSKCATCSAPRCARPRSISRKGQKGSSAMPHKRNPVTCEQICGLARVVRANAQAAFENVALWHERDISHSSVERVILPDSTILADYLLDKTTNLVDQLLVYPERMRRNLDMTRGLGVLRPAAAGSRRRRHAAREGLPHRAGPRHGSLGERRGFPRRHRGRSGDRAVLTPEQIAEGFSLDRQLRNVDKIFARVFR